MTREEYNEFVNSNRFDAWLRKYYNHQFLGNDTDEESYNIKSLLIYGLLQSLPKDCKEKSIQEVKCLIYSIIESYEHGSIQNIMKDLENPDDSVNIPGMKKFIERELINLEDKTFDTLKGSL